MKIRFTPEASQELVEARGWYDGRSEGLGDEFQSAFDSAAVAAQEHPLVYPIVHGTRRRVFIRRFPYYLLIDIVNDIVVVVGCIHFARHPAVWRRKGDT